MAYTTTIDDTSSNGRRHTRDRYAIGLATGVAAPSIYPNIADKDDVTYAWSIGPEPAGGGQVAILVAGPGTSVLFALAGLFTDGQVIDLTIERTTAVDYVDQYTVVGNETAADIAIALSAAIALEVDMSSSVSGGQVSVGVIGPVTAVEITVLTIT